MPTLDELKQAALEYHRRAPAGKIKVSPTKPVVTQRELSLAYSPGVAAACEEIVRDPAEVASVTARGNLVAVITNGTAVLGLGNIGPLAAKPVMEGKGVLFQKFAGIDVFDLEIAENDPDKLVEIIASLEPTFGGINLEDIKAPECFEVERKLRERMRIPVFHDDQHGTAIIVGAALVNALHITGKKVDRIKLVSTGAGAAGIACLDMLVSLGVDPANIWVADRARRGLEGPRRGHGPEQGALCARHRRARARRHHRRCGRVPRPVRAGHPEAGHGRAHGRAADHPRAGQPDAGDPARGSEGRAPRRDHRDRPLGLPEPGQQRAVFPVHLPRRARCRRNHDQRGDEGCLRAGDRGTRAARVERRGRARLWRQDRELRPRIRSSRSRSTRA